MRGSAVAAALCLCGAWHLLALMPDGHDVAERVSHLTRDSRWTPVATLPVHFPTFHPQGMVRVGDTYFVSSVEVRTPPQRLPPTQDGPDRTTGEGTGHLFKFDAGGRLITDLTIGEGSIYHPGGIDFDGTSIWVPVAEYRPDSRSIVYAVDPGSMKAREVLRVADHIGGVVHDTERHALHGVSWGSRRFYRWTMDGGRVTNADAPVTSIRTLNPSHYVDYQDCKYAGAARMVCTGVAEIRQAGATAPFRLGGIDLVSLDDGRPLHQAPVLLWTGSGLDMTHNPVWLEATADGLRAYFMPEDDMSCVYIYAVRTVPGP